MGEVRFKYLEELEKSEALDALNDRKSKKRESTDLGNDRSDRERERARERAESAADRRRRNTAADQTRRRRAESERIEELLREEETEEDALYNERRQRRLRARRAEQRRQLHRRRVIIAYTLRALTALVLFLVVFNTTRVIVHIVSRGDNPSESISEQTVTDSGNDGTISPAESTDSGIGLTPTPTDGSGTTWSDSGQSGLTGTPTPAPATTTTPTPAESVTVTPTPTPVVEAGASELEKKFGTWTYTNGSPMPEGDIVATDSVLYTYDMVMRDMFFLKQRYPDLCEIIKLGTTADGRDIIDVAVGSKTASKNVIIQYSMHAREYINTLLGMKQLEELLKGIQSGTEYNGITYSALLQDVRLHIIPLMNPDGVTISQLGFDGINNETIRADLNKIWATDNEAGRGDVNLAAYTSTWKANALGVDLNRNYDTLWEDAGVGGTTEPSSARYPGPSAHSEKETVALLALEEAVNCSAQIAYHSEGDLIFWNYGVEGDLYAKDEQLALTVGAVTGYPLESTVTSNQSTSGCSDYFIRELGVPSITIETGTGDCPIGIDQWDAIWAANWQVLPAVAELFTRI